MRTRILALVAVAALALPLSAAASPGLGEPARKALEAEDVRLLWSLLPESSPEEIQEILFQLAYKPWALSRMPLLAELYRESGEPLKRELIRAWIRSRSEQEAFLRALFAEAEKSPPETSLERLLQTFLRARSEDYPTMWRLLGQAEPREADLLVEWFDVHPLQLEAGLSLYRSARTEEEKDRALWVAAVGYLNGVGEPRELARAFHSCPNAEGRASLADLAGRAAPAEDLPVMREMLRASGVREARQLSRWFSRHPDPGAIPDFRARLGPIREDLWIPNALSAAGDPEVLAWALDNLHRSDNGDRVLAMNILARSPLPAAAERIRLLLAEGTDSLYALMYAFVDLDNRGPNRWWFFGEILKSAEYRPTAVHHLRYLAENGEETAKRLLSEAGS